jgi:hypothetical protein
MRAFHLHEVTGWEPVVGIVGVAFAVAVALVLLTAALRASR